MRAVVRIVAGRFEARRRGFNAFFGVRMVGESKKFVIFAIRNCGSSSVGRALASQAKGHGFESRLPLVEKQPLT